MGHLPCQTLPIQHVDDLQDAETDSAARWRRLPQDLYDDVIQEHSGNTPAMMQNSYGLPTETKLLRPSTSSSSVMDNENRSVSEKDADRDTYRLLHLRKTEILWNEAIRVHIRPNICQGELRWDMDVEKQRGLGWKECLSCTCGGYRSAQHNLYVEIENKGSRGPKTAAPNVGVQVGLTQSMISNTAFRNGLMAVNIPPPSDRSMQKTANKVCDAITDLNKDDMEMQREHLRDVNQARGLPRDTPIRAEGDGRFNNALRSGSGTTPFQPATQATYTIIENVTKKKKIISVHTANKLCSKRGRHHGACTEGSCKANIKMDDIIGDEERWAGEAYSQMQSKDGSKTMKISHFTSDGDSKAGKGIQLKQKNQEVVFLRDTQHLSVSMYKKICNTQFSASMFRQATKAKVERVKRELAHDIRRRVNGEFNSAFEKFKGDTEAMIRHFTFCTDAILSCYSGSCGELCKKHSLVCSGSKTKNWNHKYYLKFMPAASSSASSSSRPSSSSLMPTSSDKQLLRSIISMQLSPAAVKLQKFNTNTQKSEAINRSFSRTNPKVVTFSRNFEGKIHSAVHLRNRGIGQSTMMKCKILKAPITRGSKVEQALLMEQKREQQRADHHKSLKAKTSRRSARLAKYNLYSEKAERETYRKDMLINAKRSVTVEHTYAARVKKNFSAGDHTYVKK